MIKNKECTLLLVEDKEQLLDMFKVQLKCSGFNTELAKSKDDAIAIAASGCFDLAILNLGNHQMLNLEVAHNLYQANIPVVFVITSDDEKIIEQAVSSGALGCIVKPVTWIQFVSVIKLALRSVNDIKVFQDTEERLKGALETANQVNIVIGMLMERHRLSRKDAFELLRQKSRSERKKVKLIAEEIIEAWDVFNQLIER